MNCSVIKTNFGFLTGAILGLVATFQIFQTDASAGSCNCACQTKQKVSLFQTAERMCQGAQTALGSWNVKIQKIETELASGHGTLPNGDSYQFSERQILSRQNTIKSLVKSRTAAEKRADKLCLRSAALAEAIAPFEASCEDPKVLPKPTREYCKRGFTTKAVRGGKYITCKRGKMRGEGGTCWYIEEVYANTRVALAKALAAGKYTILYQGQTSGGYYQINYGSLQAAIPLPAAGARDVCSEK